MLSHLLLVQAIVSHLIINNLNDHSPLTNTLYWSITTPAWYAISLFHCPFSLSWMLVNYKSTNLVHFHFLCLCSICVVPVLFSTAGFSPPIHQQSMDVHLSNNNCFFGWTRILIFLDVIYLKKNTMTCTPWSGPIRIKRKKKKTLWFSIVQVKRTTIECTVRLNLLHQGLDLFFFIVYLSTVWEEREKKLEYVVCYKCVYFFSNRRMNN